MSKLNRLGGLVACASLLCFGAETGWAEVVRFRYVPKDACGNTVLVAGPQGAPGERQTWVGGPVELFFQSIPPTHIVTFHHPFTGQNINVPFTFPQGTPRLEHRWDRIIYNYGTYQIQARFNPDGSVTTIYNSGALRPLVFQ